MKQRNKKSISKKKWNFDTVGIDEAVVNVNLQIWGFVEPLYK